MNCLLTIAARGGSKGVPNKNIRMLADKPLIAYTIEQALQWGKAQDVVVTTDSEEIAAVARKYGAQVPFLRPPEMATDTASKLPALRHALLEMEKRKGKPYDFILDLDPTSPVRTPADLDGAVKLFLEKKPKSLFSAIAAHKSPYFNMVEVDENGLAHLSKKSGRVVFRRQDSPIVYALNASIYAYDRDFLLDPTSVGAITDRSVVYVMGDSSSIDIDREIDFQFVEFLLEKKIISF